MSDVILVAVGALPQPVLAVSRNSDDIEAFGDAEGQVFVVDSALQVCADDSWDGEANTPPEQPEPPAPRRVEMRKLKLQALETPWPMVDPTTNLWAVVKAAAAADEALEIELTSQIFDRDRDIAIALQSGLGVPDELMDALMIAAAARP